MGVPSFYRWLANRYPKIVVNAVEKTEEQDGNTPNPNFYEFDNLYLDMNGIIHPCFHPEHDEMNSSPVTFDEVFDNIFDYIDRIMNIVRPRKLLYMAIDGVAPRAKMNQQRSRRFRTAKDRQLMEKEEDRLRNQYKVEGRDVFPKVESSVEDSNIITPGTEFMYELSKQLQIYIRLRIANHPAWRSLRVILSDASSPGEGEHKIMSFIRSQRACEGYNPNTSHVLYGLDADLIMLALATHEIHFSILRENVVVEGVETNKAKESVLSRALEDTAEEMMGMGLNISKPSKKKTLLKKPYQFLHVWILREYLELDLKITDQMPEKFLPDTERLIDDFIFICFFAGNDFLPHMPTLEIHEGAIDLLMHVYTEEFKNLGGYLVDVQRINDKKRCYIKLKRVEKFILAVGAYEDNIFKKRSAVHDSKLRRILSSQATEGHEEEDLFANVDLPCNSRSLNHDMQIVENTKMLKEQLKSYTRKASDVFKNGLVTDLVKFGSLGWRRRYYKLKFSAETDEEIEKMRKILVEKYTQGLCWVLLYYFSDVPSWTWFYPYHYGPFASDLKGLSSIKVIFNKGFPFKPFDQLMAVLPPSSSQALPTPYKSLMTDEESSIIDFYPTDFEIDMDGKRFLWQGICKLPFIDEDRLLSATKNIENELTMEEAQRNVKNPDHLFVHLSENFASGIISSFKQNDLIKIDSGLSVGDINGFLRFKHESIKDPDVLCVFYELPCFTIHVPRVLAGSTIPEAVVSESDIEERQLWHDIHGYHNRRNNRSHNRTEESNRSNPCVGFRNPCPGVVTVGSGSGWKGRGSGSCHDATGTLTDQTRSRSWWGNPCPDVVTIGHGSGLNILKGHGQVYQCPRVSFRYSRGYGSERGNTYHPTRSNGSNGQLWSGRSTGSGSSYQNRWGNTSSSHGLGDASNGSWRRSN